VKLRKKSWLYEEQFLSLVIEYKQIVMEIDYQAIEKLIASVFKK
jgi:hypothetical protein